MSEFELWMTGGAVLVLLLLSGFFSGSETALTAASRARMTSLESQGDKAAARVNKLRERKDRLIGALLLGNNLVNILATALASSVLIALFGEAGVAYATLVMTLLVLIFAEVLPKTYALHHAENMARFISPAVQAVVFVFAPVTEAVTGLVRWILRRFGVDLTISMAPDLEELRGAIELHRGEAHDTKHERDMLRSVLDLGDVEVGEIMTHRRNSVMLDIDQPIGQLVDAALDSPYTRIPLWQNESDNIVGVLHAKALLKEMRARGGDVSKIDITACSATPWFIPDTTTLFNQLQAFRQRREHFALVVDEYGSFMGLVTLEDILEEIVGEIEDETDIQVAGVRPQPNGSYVVEGMVTIRDLNRQFEWGLPDDQFSTVAGLVLYEAKRIPHPGQSFLFHGFRFDVLRRQRHQVTLLRVTPPEEKRPVGTVPRLPVPEGET